MLQYGYSLVSAQKVLRFKLEPSLSQPGRNHDVRNRIPGLMKRPQTDCNSNHKAHISANGRVLKGGCHK